MKYGVSTIAFLILAGCASTNPGQGATINYLMPETNVTATLTLVLESCPNSSGKGMEVDTTLAVTATAVAGNKIYQLDAAQLASARANRNITVNVAENGVISGINSSVEDRTVAILSNTANTILRTATLAAASRPDPNDPGPRLKCKSEISNQINAVNRLEGRIKTLRESLNGSIDTVSNSKIIEDINLLALEIARIRTEELTQTLTKRIPLKNMESPTATDLGLDYDPLRKNWFKEPVSSTQSPVAQPLTNDEMKFHFGLTSETKNLPVSPAITSNKTRKLGDCSLEIRVPGQKRGTIKVTPYGNSIRDKVSESKVSTPIPQWDTDNKICLSTRFAENRNLNITYNSFGQPVSLAWMSRARAEAVTGALATSLSDVNRLQNGLGGDTQAELEQATINEVDRLLRFNTARLCLEAVRAGATSCPDPSSE